jgi:hypothetical protein
VQDSPRHFNEQLQQMASIYTNACFTITAADSRDANHRLRGVGGQALPRVYKQTYYKFSPKAKLLCEPLVESTLNLPSWYTRAWTFRERAVSRKTIVFVNDTVTGNTVRAPGMRRIERHQTLVAGSIPAPQQVGLLTHLLFIHGLVWCNTSLL